MISPFDDYPIHQTALPVATMLDGHPNAYDRFFFNGYDPDGEWFFAAAMGVYPNRGVIDAAFSVVRDGVQRSVYASGRAPDDRRATRVGPLSIEVVEPLRTNILRVNAAHLGITAELRWEPRTAAVEEPRQTIMDGPRTIMDNTRLVQWGTWQGSIDVDGSAIAVDAARVRGTKDRSWGIRPVGEPLPGAPTSILANGGVFFLWAPVHFDDICAHFLVFEHPDGERWYSNAHEVPLLGADDEAYGAKLRHPRWVDYDVDWIPGTRRSRGARLTYRFGSTDEEFILEPLLDFQMRGIGYFHEKWGHGMWHGETAEGSDEWKVADLDMLAMNNIHIEQLVRVTRGAKVGVGVLEQLILGPHAPTGFADILDGAK